MRRPDYFDKFHCIGGACKDTCCAGWEIEVDEESSLRYQQMKGSIGKRLRKELTVTPEESYFALKDGKCPFLNKEGLCDLILAEGEGILCDICREHPRFYNWYGSRTEVGLGMCCEEAERLMFADSRPAAFVMDETEEFAKDDPEEQFVGQMMAAREMAFQIVQDRTIPLGRRLICLQAFGEQLQELMDEDRLEELELLKVDDCVSEEPASAVNAVRELLAEYAKLEALDESWPGLLLEAEKEAEALLLQSSAFHAEYSQTEWEYEHLIVYFLNRYFMESVYDMDVVSKVRFGLAAVLVIRLLEIQNWLKTGKRTEQSRDELIRRYSKEIEYCPENVTALTEACWTLGVLQTDSLNAMLSQLI